MPNKIDLATDTHLGVAYMRFRGESKHEHSRSIDVPELSIVIDIDTDGQIHGIEFLSLNRIKDLIE